LSQFSKKGADPEENFFFWNDNVVILIFKKRRGQAALSGEVNRCQQYASVSLRQANTRMTAKLRAKSTLTRRSGEKFEIDPQTEPLRIIQDPGFGNNKKKNERSKN